MGDGSGGVSLLEAVVHTRRLMGELRFLSRLCFDLLPARAKARAKAGTAARAASGRGYGFAAAGGGGSLPLSLQLPRL